MISYTEEINRKSEELRNSVREHLEFHGLKHKWLVDQLRVRYKKDTSAFCLEKTLGGRASAKSFDILVASGKILTLYEEVFYANGEKVLPR